jgi:hypothetical protein
MGANFMCVLQAVASETKGRFGGTSGYRIFLKLMFKGFQPPYYEFSSYLQHKGHIRITATNSYFKQHFGFQSVTLCPLLMGDLHEMYKMNA